MNNQELLTTLKSFCSIDPNRPHIQNPFTHDGWTYFTDGRIAIRVPSIPEVAASQQAPNQKIAAYFVPPFTLTTDAGFRPLPLFKEEPCSYCEGKGKRNKVQCPDCCTEIVLPVEISCDQCGGSGLQLEENEKRNGVPFGAQLVNPFYLKKLATLPGIKLANAKDEGGAMPFSFDGGFGMLMPMHR